MPVTKAVLQRFVDLGKLQTGQPICKKNSQPTEGGHGKYFRKKPP